MNLDELIEGIETLNRVTVRELQNVIFSFKRPFQATENIPFCDWCFSGWTNYMPDEESGVYFICSPKSEVIYIGKATADNLGAEIWGKFGKPSEDENGKKFFNKSYFLSKQSPDLSNNPSLQSAILSGNVFISTIVVTPSHVSSFIEVYLQTIHFFQENGQLPVLNKRIG